MIRAALCVLLFLAGCGSGGPSETAPAGEQPERRAAVDATAAEVWAPAYGTLHERTSDLLSAVEVACAEPSPSAFDAARAAWIEASAQWIEMRPYRFGPVKDLRLSGAVEFPIDADKIDRMVATEPDVTGLRNRGADVKGLRAIEHLLFASDEPVGAQECAYAEESARLVAEAAGLLDDAWQTYPDELGAMPAQDVLDLAVNELIFSLRELQMERLAPATGLAAPGAPGELDGAAAHGAAAAAAAAQGALEAYLGGPGGGLGNLVRVMSADADQRLTAELQAARDALASLGPSLVEADPDRLEEALHATGAARTTLSTEIASLLGVTLMLGDSDGDG